MESCYSRDDTHLMGTQKFKSSFHSYICPVSLPLVNLRFSALQYLSYHSPSNELHQPY